jgi:lysine-specific demethylase 8
MGFARGLPGVHRRAGTLSGVAARGTLDNVGRVRAPDPLTFERRYLRTGTPVILTGLYDGLPVRRLADARVAQTALADMELVVTPNDIGELLVRSTDADLDARHTTFGPFYDDLEISGPNGEFCVEHDTPDELAAYLPPPAYLRLGAPEETWESYIYLAGRGSSVHLHFDCDLRHVLMYQVFGRKRYVIIDPAESRKLGPGTRPHLRRTSALYLEHFSDADLLAFLRYANAWDCVLEPGEALLIPATCWHYVEYVDTALSANFRFGRNRYTHALSQILPESSVEMQALAARFRDAAAVGPDEEAAFAALQRADDAWYPDRATRQAALDALCVELCARLRLPVAGSPYHAADIARRQRVAAVLGGAKRIAGV